MSKGQSRNYDRFAAVCFFLMQKPHSVSSLVNALGLNPHGGSESSVARCISSLEAEGLVAIVGLEPLKDPSTPIRNRAKLWGWVLPPSYQTPNHTESIPK